MYISCTSEWYLIKHMFLRHFKDYYMLIHVSLYNSQKLHWIFPKIQQPKAIAICFAMQNTETTTEKTNLMGFLHRQQQQQRQIIAQKHSGHTFFLHARDIKSKIHISRDNKHLTEMKHLLEFIRVGCCMRCHCCYDRI